MAASAMAKTHFAPAGRSDADNLRRQVDFFNGESLPQQLLDALPTILVVLNAQRQIVFANRPLLTFIEAENADVIVGMRPGEILDCDHVPAGLDGCGTSEPCSTCGAILSILTCQQGVPDSRECRVSRKTDQGLQAIDLRIWTTPFHYNQEDFTILALEDISSEKRKDVLEKLFFHDVLNVIGTIRGFSELLVDYQPKDREGIYRLLHQAADQLINQIQGHRLLIAAERRELKLRWESLPVSPFLQNLVDIYRHHDSAGNHSLIVSGPIPETDLETDRALLSRILGNLMVNACEASPGQSTIEVGCIRHESNLEFWVENPGEMPREVQLQVFQRSFSTKGDGRGLGTYSVRLFSEYLGGRAVFICRSGRTRFSVRYPLVRSDSAGLV